MNDWVPLTIGIVGFAVAAVLYPINRRGRREHRERVTAIVTAIAGLIGPADAAEAERDPETWVDATVGLTGIEALNDRIRQLGSVAAPTAAAAPGVYDPRQVTLAAIAYEVWHGDAAPYASIADFDTLADDDHAAISALRNGETA